MVITLKTLKAYRLELDSNQYPLLVQEQEIISYNLLINAQEAVNLCNSTYHIEHAAEEFVIMIAVNSIYKPIALFEISHGSVNQSICNTREVFIRALAVGASAFFVLHNHPSGNPSPSDSDLRCALRLKKAGELLGIQLHDFIIIGSNTYFSLKEQQIANE